jgi:hypothetical protein
VTLVGQGGLALSISGCSCLAQWDYMAGQFRCIFWTTGTIPLSDQGLARNIVDLECAGIDVAQHQIGCASRVDWSNASELPIQPERADESSASELVVADVVYPTRRALVIMAPKETPMIFTLIASEPA